MIDQIVTNKGENRPNPNKAFPNPNIPSLCYIKNVVKNPRIIIGFMAKPMVWMHTILPTRWFDYIVKHAS